MGLAAPQVGVNVRLMVFNPYGSEKPGNESILVNPEVVETSRIRGTGEEGCLSFPKIYGDVEVCKTSLLLYVAAQERYVLCWLSACEQNCLAAQCRFAASESLCLQ